jgi:hypothetical protein
MPLTDDHLDAAAKKKSTSASGAGRAFTAALESLRRDFQVFGGALASLREEMNERFQATHARIDTLREDMRQRLERVEADMGLVKVAILETRRELKEGLGRKVDREELVAARLLAK